MSPYIRLRAILFLTILLHLVNGRENIMGISSKVIRFNDTYFMKFFYCLSNKHSECVIYFKKEQPLWTQESVYDVEATSSKSTYSAAAVYTCRLNDNSFLTLDFVKCVLGNGDTCLGLSSKFDSQTVAIRWTSIYDYLDSGLIKNSFSNCSRYLDLILYWKNSPDGRDNYPKSYVPGHEEEFKPTYREPSLKGLFTLSPLPTPTTSTDINYKIIGSVIGVTSALILIAVILCLRYKRTMNKNILRKKESLQNDGRSVRRENRRNNKNGSRVMAYGSENKNTDHILSVDRVKSKTAGLCNAAGSFQGDFKAGDNIAANVTGYSIAGGIRSMEHDTREEKYKPVVTKTSDC